MHTKSLTYKDGTQKDKTTYSGVVHVPYTYFITKGLDNLLRCSTCTEHLLHSKETAYYGVAHVPYTYFITKRQDNLPRCGTVPGESHVPYTHFIINT